MYESHLTLFILVEQSKSFLDELFLGFDPVLILGGRNPFLHLRCTPASAAVFQSAPI